MPFDSSRPISLLQTKAGDKRPQKPKGRARETRLGDQVGDGCLPLLEAQGIALLHE